MLNFLLVLTYPNLTKIRDKKVLPALVGFNLWNFFFIQINYLYSNMQYIIYVQHIGTAWNNLRGWRNRASRKKKKLKYKAKKLQEKTAWLAGRNKIWFEPRNGAHFRNIFLNKIAQTFAIPFALFFFSLEHVAAISTLISSNLFILGSQRNCFLSLSLCLWARGI